LYSTDVNNELGTCEKSGRDFCKTSLALTLTSEVRVLKPKACGVQGRIPGVGRGG